MEAVCRWVINAVSKRRRTFNSIFRRSPNGKGGQIQIRGIQNEAEYEALFLGLKICWEVGANTLSTFSDSQLIVGRVNGEFEAKDDSMKMYLQQVQEFVKKFDKFTLVHILRSQNAQADSLAKLANSAETSAARDIIYEVLPNPSINFMVNTIDRSETWMEPYMKYL